MPYWVSCFREISEQHVTQKDHMYSGAAAIWGVSCGSFYFFIFLTYQPWKHLEGVSCSHQKISIQTNLDLLLPATHLELK